MPKYSVLHILDHSLPMLSGYSVRSRDILAAQSARGWSVTAVTGARHVEAGPILDRQAGIFYHRLPQRPSAHRRGLLHLASEVAALVRHILAVAQDARPDILHAHSPALNGVAAAIAARHLAVPLVYEVRAFWEDAAVANGQTQIGSLRYQLTRWLEGLVLARADAIIPICQGLAEDFGARGISADKMTIVPNGLRQMGQGQDEAVSALDDPLGLSNADVISFIGSFYAYEGLADLIAVMPLVLEHHPHAALVLLGAGPDTQALRAAAAASPAAARIFIIGPVAPEDVPAYYALAKVMVYPRRSTRLTELVTPLKPLEAMSMGKLVALSDIGGHRDLLGPALAAYFFPPHDPARLAETVARALKDAAAGSDRALQGQAYVWAHHDWSHLVDHYEAVYHRLVN